MIGWSGTRIVWAGSAGVAGALAAVSDLAPHRVWGVAAALGYGAAAMLAGSHRRAAVGVALLGAVAVPLVLLVATGRGQLEVAVVERSGALLTATGVPYAREPGGLADYNPYLPGMAVLGALPGDPRWWTGAVFVASVAAVGASPRVAGWVVACPLVALPLAVGGVDLPVAGLMCLGLTLAGRGRAGRAGLALGAAAALKWTAWPAVLVALALLVAVGRRPCRVGLGRWGECGHAVAAVTAGGWWRGPSGLTSSRPAALGTSEREPFRRLPQALRGRPCTDPPRAVAIRGTGVRAPAMGICRPVGDGGPARWGLGVRSRGGRKGCRGSGVVTRWDSVRTLLNMDMHTVVVGTSGATAQDVIAVARGNARVELSPEALTALAKAREIVDALAAKPEPVYGVSTGFGALATRHISPELRAQLQRNIVRSHAAGMGAPVEREVVRALMFLRLKTVCSGHTGVRPQVAQTMADVLNAGITPVVHEYGSLGCSGDLAPLSHCALTLMGEGDAEGPDGRVRPAGELLAEHGIEPVELREKEGLALLNGTDGMLGMLIMALDDLDKLYKSADITAALSLEALLGTEKVLAPELHAIRPHPGQGAAAANMLAVLKGSGLTGHFQQDEAPRVQDAYSVRCAPQVAGAGRDTMAHARLVAERELASAVDNPVVLPDGRVESNGNFHGAPVAYVLDFLAIAAADLGSIAERRTDRLLDKNRSHGLPPFLADDAGVDSGLMIAQYTQAALVSELKRLAVPASADSIPSSAMQEDHVSMGWSAARKLRTAVGNLGRIIAVELYAATRAIELRDGLTPAPASRAAIEALRAAGVQGPGPDRFLAPDLEAADAFVREGKLVEAVEKVTGPLA